MKKIEKRAKEKPRLYSACVCGNVKRAGSEKCRECWKHSRRMAVGILGKTKAQRDAEMKRRLYIP